MTTLIRAGCLALLLMCGFTHAAAQSEPACPVPPEVDAPVGLNLFTPQQEIELGDILAEQLEHKYHLVEDDALTTYLNHAAQRILEQLPPNELHFQVFLYDDSEANAFSLPGGRIYISRKLVAFVRNEDELAGLLGHEMGHIISRQMAIQQSALLQKILGVTAVTDRQDIESKYNQLLRVEEDPGVLFAGLSGLAGRDPHRPDDHRPHQGPRIQRLLSRLGRRSPRCAARWAGRDA